MKKALSIRSLSRRERAGVRGIPLLAAPATGLSLALAAGELFLALILLASGGFPPALMRALQIFLRF